MEKTKFAAALLLTAVFVLPARGAPTDILKGISCSADYGDVLCLLGPNGCGKTTLFRIILGSLPVSNGKIKIAGKNISESGRAHV